MSLAGRIKIAHGALVIEGLLLRDLERLVNRGCKGAVPLPPRHPVRVIVPSVSLRRHLGKVVVDHFGGKAVAGVLIQTLYATAQEILMRAGEGPAIGNSMLEILVRRFAREEPCLREALDDLVDGYGTVVATVLDLLDAGFEAVHAEGMDDMLTEFDGSVASEACLERFRALVRVASKTHEALRGSGWLSGVFKWAAMLLQDGPRDLLPASAILVHGFADATGVACDLIEALVRHCRAWVYLDRPPDPARPGEDDLGVQFTLRFFDRLRGVASTVDTSRAALREPDVRLVRAAGANAEVRAVAIKIAELWENGACLERVGVVARDLSPYRVPVRLHFQRLGVPFSCVGTKGPPGGAGRRIRALLELLKGMENCLVDQWLDAVDVDEGPDLRLCFRSLGVSRLHDVVSINPGEVLNEQGYYPLPVRRGLVGEDDSASGKKTLASRRKLASGVLLEALRLARCAVDMWEKWPVSGGPRSHEDALLRLLHEALLWSHGSPGFHEVLDALDLLRKEVPTDFSISYNEFILLLSKVLCDAGTTPLGGEGGGVQVLDVMEARGRTFDQLFILGMNRDVFPRVIREDPLLPDPIRRAMAALLPDIPIKASGYDEERYLFAQLMSSSPCITLSWQAVDEDGNALSPSPFLERLRLAKGWMEPELAHPVYALPLQRGDSEKGAVRPAYEHAVIVGLYGSREHYNQIVPLAVAETHSQEGLASEDLLHRVQAIAEAKVAVLEEIDPDRRTPEGRTRFALLGPYFGLVGTKRPSTDLGDQDQYISTLEKMATCPWRTLLTHLLRIEPTPDPLEALPGVDELLLGIVVHRVLEELARRAISQMPRAIGEAITSQGSTRGWPEEDELERILSDVSERTAREASIALPGIARVLKARARPYLELAKTLDWTGTSEDLRLLAAEVEGSLCLRDALGTPEVRLHFRADRLDRFQGRIRVTDYKTGRPISTAVQEKTRYRHFLRDVRAGLHLQAIAYVLGLEGVQVEGRYVFLKPDIPDDSRVYRVTSADREFLQAFEDAVKTLVDGMELGVFFPRLVEPDGLEEPRACSYCEVAQACLRGDTGAKERLVSWLEGARRTTDENYLQRDYEKALVKLWLLRGREVQEPE